MREVRVLREEQVDRRDAHHRRDPLLLDQPQDALGVELPLEDHRRALQPGEQRLHVPPADMELRQDLQHDVVAVHAGRRVEAEVRPEAVRVREQRTLGLSGRAGRVDEQEAIVGRDQVVRQRGCGARLLERLPVAAGRVCQVAVLVLDQAKRGLGVVELVLQLGRRQPPRERQQDQAEPRAGEEHHHVLWRVARERGDAVAAPQPHLRERGGERIRAGGQLGVGHEPAVRVDRDARRRVARTVGEPAADDHDRNSVTSSATRSESSHTSRCPRSGTISTRAFGISSPSSSALRGSTTLSAPPCTTSVGA